MRTDTAFFHNPHYHQSTDTLETLGIEYIRKNTETATKILKGLLQKKTSGMKKNQKDQAEINGKTENEIPTEKTKKRSSVLFLGLIYFFSLSSFY
jgi:hypothetical protein